MSTPGSTRHLVRDLGIIVIFVLATMMPFINMPVHMDDPTHLEFARVQVEHPFQQDIPGYIYFGQYFESFRDTHPRGHSLLLSLILRADPSEDEAPMHATFLVFPLIAGISMYFLARRFDAPPLLSALLLMAAPVVLVTFHSLMTDPPGMSMWLASVTAYIYGSDRRSMLLLAAATIFLLIGTFISYQVLSVIPLLMAYMLLKRRRSLAEIVPLAVPAAAFVLSALATRWQYGEWPMFSYRTGLRVMPSDMLRKGRGILVILGGVIVVPWVAWFAFIRKKPDLFMAMAATAVATAIALPFYLSDDLTPNQLILTILFAPVSALIFWRLCWGTMAPRMKSDDVFLALWSGGVLSYCLVILPYASPRYLLPLAPPVVLLAARGLKQLSRSNGTAFGIIGAIAVLATLALSVPVAIADYDRAESYRTIARDMGERYSAPGRTIWFDGDLGFRYYMEKAGFRILGPDDDSPKPGDIIIWANLAHAWDLSPQLMERSIVADTIQIYGRLPLVTLNYKDESGIYGHRNVMVPFAFTRDFSELFFVLEVVRPEQPASGPAGQIALP
ncbi:MAG: glycosyltransferase family 39 protein [Thermoleophilia bacterium]|nr:glycosyltransferase family 39 protein [Thermoleophilia bacterium]